MSVIFVKKEIARKTILLLLVTSLMILTACQGGVYGANRGCSEGDLCNYYTGTRGIMTILDRPPTTLYYRSSDMIEANMGGSTDANSVEFNLRLRNDGASDAYGAVFFSGIGVETYELRRIDSAGERVVLVPKTRQACFIDFFNIGDLTKPLSWNFMSSCFGMEISQYGDRSNFRLNAEHIVSALYKDKTPPSWLTSLNLGIQVGNGTITQFSLGTDFGLIRFGRSLLLIISNLNFEAFGGMQFTLAGDNPDHPGGEIDFKTFRLQLLDWPAGQDYYNLPYNIKTCYAYTTFVSPMVCIDPDPYSDESKTCTDFSYSWKGSQGAPVAVTNVRTTNTGREVILQATIRNIGPGTVWDVGYLEYCSPYFPATVRPSMKNVVYVGILMLENRALDCSSSYKIHLDPRTQEGRLTCRYDLVNTPYVGSAYSAPLRMELWYGYEENLKGQITVRRLN